MPLVMLCAALIVTTPAVPISSVWLALLMEIAAAEVAVFSIFRVELAAVLMLSTTPLSTVPNTSSTPPPVAEIVPVPV
ncbi:hypothetical protein EN814_25195 [Mesorhizobium sp. M2D.F.Ca.ET.171.01.1.1]|nr:hypothetical protein EN868_27405 [Mesorhizobium sp. M2D.F.Ca.ET.225.01.1.1]TGP73105.1 hypothetical protein EN867_23080 [Mesorhizobium sp. M2D.F.Ca.ET.224.01.1.1]TGP85745.1 hypothetical protein EN864_25640 [bacterium M00.F.Ca.ET.221.01.1.1]TGP90972.1 hypothetical protein EN865_23085 [bacterium M00.F.Ca.ET.222.01.1.1]TGQ83064.1 hypothetical protein EN849_27195 [Mesorhizobium sp. M2D.F.Ca.ET.206.01.1.1]TGS92381.1 hypothetical protein EN821_25205 [Mesorhizobium sp. M2D.F.Ca.ET.178.01.1.1]TGT08